VDVSLSVGEASVSVDVAAGTILVDTREAQIRETIDRARIAGLPTFNRNPYDLLQTATGVTSYTPDSVIGSRDATNFSVNGFPVNSTSFYLDGSYDNSYRAVGFALDVFGDGRTKSARGLRTLLFQQVENASGGTTQQPYFVNQTINSIGGIDDPYAPGVSPSPITVTRANAKFVPGAAISSVPSNHGSTPYAHEYNLSVEQQLTPSVGLRISYVGAGFMKQYITLDVNTHPCTRPNASVTTARIYPRHPYQPTPSTFTFGAINQNTNANNNPYNSLQTTLQPRIRRSLNLNSCYVWSKATNFTTPTVDQSDIRKFWTSGY
jgi:hypothetical protein